MYLNQRYQNIPLYITENGGFSKKKERERERELQITYKICLFFSTMIHFYEALFSILAGLQYHDNICMDLLISLWSFRLRPNRT